MSETTATEAAAGAAPVALTTSPLSLQAVVGAVSHPGAGAVVTFVGAVRDVNDARQVTLLEYQAYEPMAIAEMANILREISQEMPGVRAAAQHRIGALQVSEAAVVCAASAPHRADAFEACRRIIDRIKERVPIWKREHGPDGPYWVGWEDARCVADHHVHAHKS